MTTLTQHDKLNFWMRVYLGTSNVQDLQKSAVDRAYRDVNRTMRGISKNQTPEKYSKLRDIVIDIVSEPLTKTFNQQEYDTWHETKCDDLIAKFKDVLDFDIHYGQAQKWINMSLKYMFAIGPDIIDGIEKNYEYFHIPLDNVIQDKLLALKQIPKIETWSQINDYGVYLNYQKEVRSKFPGEIPMDVEFRLFNE